MLTKKSLGEYVFDAFNYLFLTLLVIVTLYPCLYVLFASVSAPALIYESGGLLIWPKGFYPYTYVKVLTTPLIWTGYRNTLIYVLCGGGFSVLITVMSAFALTRRGLPGKNIISLMIVFTMYFGGGLIPTYLVVKGLGLINTPFAMIFPIAISTYNLIITISYFRSLPYELEESAKIDGAGYYTVLFRIMMPLAKPIIAVIALYYMVGIWNNYFTAMIYLDNTKLYPLQLILREILIQGQTSQIDNTAYASDATQAYKENIKYATIVVSTVPILLVYPFLQKYFVKGVMIGAIKE